MQLLHEAALVGMAVRDGTAKLGLTLSCKSTLLADDKSVGKADRWSPRGSRAAATVLGIETAVEKRRCASNQWKRIWKDKADEGRRESTG